MAHFLFSCEFVARKEVYTSSYLLSASTEDDALVEGWKLFREEWEQEDIWEDILPIHTEVSLDNGLDQV